MTSHSPAASSFSGESRACGQWQRRAACRSLPCELFFPIGTTGRAVDEIAMAKEICTTCDVKHQQCFTESADPLHFDIDDSRCPFLYQTIK